MGMLRVMDQRKGDRTLVWPDEVTEEEARKEFEDLVKGEGRFRAYHVTKEGGRRTGEPIKEFDPEAEEILLAPPLAGGC